jgi:hypothetical protein
MAMEEKPAREIKTYEEMSQAAVDMTKVLYPYVNEKSGRDIVLAIRGMAYTLGLLISDLPLNVRDIALEAVIKDARETEKSISAAGMGGRCNFVEVKSKEGKLW